MNLELSALDWLVLVGYIAGICAAGVLVGLRVRTTDQYFLGGRKFGRLLMMGQSFGVGTHAEMPVALAGAVYTHGISGIWFQWKNLFATPFYWLMAPMFRRFRRTTLAEVVEDRYGPWMGAGYTLFAFGFFTITMAAMHKGAAKVISQAAGGNVPVDSLILAMTVVFVIYSFVGGLVAAAWTGFLQGFLIIVLSFLVVPVGWRLVGGLDGIQSALEPHKRSLATPQGIGPWFIAMLTLNGLVGIAAQPHILATVGTGRDETACRTGFLYGSFIKRFCTIGWAITGVIVAVIVARGIFGDRALPDAESAFGYACRHLLFPGGVGLLIASVLAANMSTSSALMVNSGALFTRSVYQRFFVKDRTDRHYLMVGRCSGLLVSVLAVAYAIFLIDRVLYAFLLTETVAAFVGISLLGGIVWPRANRWGALASIVAALGTNFALYHLRGQRLNHWEPEVFLCAFLAGVAGLVIVSLLTPPEPVAATATFFRRLQTPGEEDASAGDAAAQLRASAQAGMQLLLVNLLHPRRGAAGCGFFHAYREDLKGFFIGGMITAGLVAAVWLLFHF